MKRDVQMTNYVKFARQFSFNRKVVKCGSCADKRNILDMWFVSIVGYLCPKCYNKEAV